MTDFALKPRWDIFCKVVDNFGDIGVCWRLARQLHAEHGLQIRLWIDDLEVAQAIIPSLNITENSQVCEEITILKWHENADFEQAAEVVIEAFACGLPPAYLAAMARNKLAGIESKWVNLEYLSAENWVDDFHGKPSPQANGLTRHFYFPGFTEATGGLLRKRDVEITQGANHKDALKISLFCYPNAPIHDLFTALSANKHAVAVYVPATSILPQIADFFGVETITAGDYLSRENLHVHILPFLSQPDYDKLLCDCDLNFVRGEDSWVRAIWAGKPFIWQPYFQDGNAHMKKLEAFLTLFYDNFNQKEMLWKVHECWAAGPHWNDLVQWQLPFDALNAYLNNLNALKTYTLQQSKQLAQQTDLAAKLVIFCNKL